MGGPLALDGRHLMGGHNNQPKVGIDSRRALKRKGNRGGMCVGVLSLCLERQIDEEKKRQQKYVVALDDRRQMKITQQPTKSTPM
jgi:hypothetical protein